MSFLKNAARIMSEIVCDPDTCGKRAVLDESIFDLADRRHPDDIRSGQRFACHISPGHDLKRLDAIWKGTGRIALCDVG